MNRNDILGSFEVIEDDWTLSKPVFGLQNQISVEGWFRKSNSKVYGYKVYLVKCSICAKDKELNGEGLELKINLADFKCYLEEMSNKELAELNFLIFQEAQKRAAVETEREMQLLVDSALKNK